MARIFEFVRDNIAFEAYPGVLRGPRGTLLARAGNSADRAALLASLLTESGFQIRYVRGTLPERNARELVSSVWSGVGNPVSLTAPASDAANPTAEAFVAAGKRNYQRIHDVLKGARMGEKPAAPSFDALVGEARTHYWVQVQKDSRWIDLDPSFADAAAGKTYASAEETMPALPAALYHRITVRIVAEESDGTQSATRELLTSSANAADLSGVGVLLVHVPENWQGPVRNIQGALGAALSETGRIKPLLLITGREHIAGAPFRTVLKTTGVGGLGDLLSGEGTRKPLEMAIAEWIEFKFDYPDGRSETLVRELFDLVGKAKRARPEALTQEEIRALATGDRTRFLTATAFNIFFTTGRLDAAHLEGLAPGSNSGPEQSGGNAAALRRLAIAFHLISDALFKKLKTRDGTMISFYPDSPRVFIDDLSLDAQQVRLTIDLRRDRVRVLAARPNGQAVVSANALRGAVDGALEQALVDHVTANVPATIRMISSLSTSLLFAQADAQRVPAFLVTSDQTRMDASIPADALARLFDDVRQGNYALALERPIEVAGLPRYAWWRVDPRTGETVAVTDQGLHQSGSDYVLVTEQEEGKWDATLVAGQQRTVTPLAQGLAESAMHDFIRQLVAAGVRNIIIPGF
jgi:transglutaminase-like putative cysteine protease